MRCFHCHNAELRQVEEEVQLEVDLKGGAQPFSVSGVPATRCSSCGESFMAAADLQRAELQVGAELADRGIREGAAFRFMRKALGLRAVDLAGLLDVTAETVSHWENDHTAADSGAWAALAAMISDRLAGKTTTIDRLRATKEPRRTSGPVQLRLAHG